MATNRVKSFNPTRDAYEVAQHLRALLESGREFNDAQWALMQDQWDRVYFDFVIGEVKVSDYLK